jgi:protein-arginine kinase activator protein McsA
MDIKQLTKEQEKESKEWLRSYKFVNICKKCGVMYGSDLQERIIICPKCYNKFKGKENK